MLFNSIKFLIFFPIVSIIYFTIPQKIKSLWLLIMSYFFYMCWNPKYVILIATSTLITYYSGILIEKVESINSQKKKQHGKKIVVILSIVSNLSILFFFKYFPFAINNLNAGLSIFNISFNIPTFDILLPVGISFYTFQALGYTIDVYRQEIPAEKSLLKYALFVSFFPQLVAGPIERSKNLLNQINKENHFEYNRVKNGLLLMIWGLFQKMVIADHIAIVVNQIYDNYEQYTGVYLMFATILFAFQIYCDFAGYSNIAIGAARVMGFSLMDNFKRPYFARSVGDFWRRWHISLSTWFRDYLYIPLGGNRCSKLRKYFNLMVTFLISGLWHGASWNYVVWGGMNGSYQVIGDFIKPLRQTVSDKLNVRKECFSYRLLCKISTFILIDFSWLFFRADGFRNGCMMLKIIFGNFSFASIFDHVSYPIGLDGYDFKIMILGILLLIVIDCMSERLDVLEWLSEQNIWFRWTMYYVLILSIIIFGVYGISYNSEQFIYFQF